MAIVWKNRIRDILDRKGWTISDLQRETRLSYPTTHRIATDDYISGTIKTGTLRTIAAALGVEITDLFEEVITQDD